MGRADKFFAMIIVLLIAVILGALFITPGGGTRPAAGAVLKAATDLGKQTAGFFMITIQGIENEIRARSVDTSSPQPQSGGNPIQDVHGPVDSYRQSQDQLYEKSIDSIGGK